MVRVGTKKKIFVGLSGGVDSSVASLRLQREGHEVVGVFIKVWHPDFLICDWEEERLDAMRVAARLGIPFVTFDAEAVYKKEVADYMIEEYKRGRTPNPDVMCNRHVKFGAFLEFAREHGADAIATGHYARVRENDGHCHLLRGRDTAKDQSYFLWTLKQEELRYVLFPLGDSRKSDVRREAARAGLLTAKKHDSQGICFLGKIDLKEFLSHYVDTEPGDVLDEKGIVIGQHDGALFYTIGQRHGFTITAGEEERTPRYVISKDVEKNTITVSEHPPRRTKGDIAIDALNEIQDFDMHSEIEAQFRYRQQPFKVRLTKQDDVHATVEVLEEIETPSVGQSAVFYDGDECLGGGIICEGIAYSD